MKNFFFSRESEVSAGIFLLREIFVFLKKMAKKMTMEGVNRRIKAILRTPQSQTTHATPSPQVDTPPPPPPPPPPPLLQLQSPTPERNNPVVHRVVVHNPVVVQVRPPTVHELNLQREAISRRSESLEAESRLVVAQEKIASLEKQIAAANERIAALEKEVGRLSGTKHAGGRPKKDAKKSSPRPAKKILLNLKHRDLKTIHEEVRTLIRHNFETSGMSLREHAKQYNTTDKHLKNIVSAPTPSPPRKKTAATAKKEILDRAIKSASEQHNRCARDVVEHLRRNGHLVSIPYVRSSLRHQGLRYKLSRIVPALTDGHKKDRVMFATQMLENRHAFESLIFSDEKQFGLRPSRQGSWVMEGSAPPTQGQRRKGPVGGIMLWLGIGVFSDALYQANKSLFINRFCLAPIEATTINSESYKKILSERIVPFADTHIFLQDNAGPHTSKEVKEFICKNKIKTSFENVSISWPALSPDLNVIENVWSFCVHKLNLLPSYPSSIKELRNSVLEIMASKDCEEYIKKVLLSFGSRLQKCIDAKGEFLKY